MRKWQIGDRIAADNTTWIIENLAGCSEIWPDSVRARDEADGVCGLFTPAQLAEATLICEATRPPHNLPDIIMALELADLVGQDEQDHTDLGHNDGQNVAGYLRAQALNALKAMV